MFSAEPDVHQPIAMTFDDRGRLWVAECYTYSNAKTNFDLNLHDRILIFEDSKGTGHFGKKTVFWDKGQRLTSIAVGFGGVYATCAPNLLFIPDRNGDDVPDGPPEVLLDGWNDNAVRHNIVNGLKWGPDGWLYGRHGIMAESAVGKPGTPEAERIKLSCCIWRFHPTKKSFEVVCQGTTNPWGHDWDQYGNLFFINTVIGHLWLGVPGAFYKRMYGEPLVPYRYGLIDQAADHYHWNTGKTWQDSRNAAAGADVLGGGHAHSGLMIYQGENWPEQYRGRIFTLNLHGRRINEDRLEREGSGIAGRHEPDFGFFEDPWFLGIDLDYGPDGGVYVLDWSDTGECHGADNVSLTNGRIYKLTYGDTQTATTGRSHPAPLSLLTHSLATLPEADLIRLHLQPNEWYVRHARRILQERTHNPENVKRIATELLALYENQTDPIQKLRLMFTLHSIGGDSFEWLKSQLDSQDDHIRSRAVQFLTEAGSAWPGVLPAFVKLAQQDRSATVRLHLASALQHFPVASRPSLAGALLRHGEDVNDHYLPLMLWYGVEPITADFPTNAIELAAQSHIPLVREYVARRLGDNLTKGPAAVEALLESTTRLESSAQVDVFHGLISALENHQRTPMPLAWERLRRTVVASGNGELIKLALDLGVLFGDPWARDELKHIVLNTSADADDRRAALRRTIDSRPSDLRSLLHKLLDDRQLAGVAARGLLLFNDADVPQEVFKRWDSLGAEDHTAVAGLMSSRVSFAEALLDAIGKGRVPRSVLNAFQARQIRSFNNEALNRKLTEVWGEVRPASADKAQLMTKYKALLVPERLKQADLSKGREVFNQTCALCHKLYGQGASIGPDITGGGRASLEYLLENILNPSAIVPADYRVSEVELKDERSYSASIVAKTDSTITIQTPTEKLTIDRNDVARIRETTVSLMPDGLLQGMTDEQVNNLIAYLMAPNQVSLPVGPTK